MKALLEFNLPEDAHEYRCATKGTDYLGALLDIMRLLKEKQKYGEEDKISVSDLREEIYRDILTEDVKVDL